MLKKPVDCSVFLELASKSTCYNGSANGEIIFSPALVSLTLNSTISFLELYHGVRILTILYSNVNAGHVGSII